MKDKLMDMPRRSEKIRDYILMHGEKPKHRKRRAIALVTLGIGVGALSTLVPLMVLHYTNRCLQVEYEDNGSLNPRRSQLESPLSFT